MTKSLRKNTIREITQTKARFLSILAIIGLGVGFFCWCKGNQPCHGADGAYILCTAKFNGFPPGFHGGV